MNTGSDNVEWWQKVPCHFTWSLEDTDEDYNTMKNKVKSTLESWNEEHPNSPPCQPLLFLGFLEVSKFKGLPRQNPVQAMKQFSNVEREAAKMPVAEERNACMTVALANRIWCNEILSQSQEGKEDVDALHKSKPKTGEETDDMRRLKRLWNEKNEIIEAYIEGIAVFSLEYLGPRKYKDAEDRCRKALVVIPTNPEWHHSLGCFIGRQSRDKVFNSRSGYNHIEEEVKCYEEALRLDPAFDLARCTLAQVLVKIPKRKKEAAKHIESVHQNTCSMVIKKGRFYRLAKDYTKALEVLMKGESEFSSPRSELFFQTSLVYEALAKLPRVDQTTKKNNLEKHIAYCNKCLELEPQHFPALLKKARALGQLKRNDAAEKVFREAMRVVKARPKNFVEAQYWFAEHLTFRNRKQVTPEAAELYQGAMSTALSMIQNADDFAIDDIKKSMKWFVTNSKKKLDEFYQGNPSSNIVHIERMFASFHF